MKNPFKQNKFRISILIVLGIFLASSATATWQGSGTQNDPYIIQDNNDLTEIDPNSGNENDPAQLEAYYILGNSFNITNTFSTINGNFRGTLDGNGNTLEGLYSTMFGKLDDDSRVKNIVFEGFDKDSTLAGAYGTSNITVSGLKFQNGDINVQHEDKAGLLTEQFTNDASKSERLFTDIQLINSTIEDDAETSPDGTVFRNGFFTSDLKGATFKRLRFYNLNVRYTNNEDANQNPIDISDRLAVITGDWNGNITVKDAKYNQIDIDNGKVTSFDNSRHGLISNRVDNTEPGDKLENILIVNTNTPNTNYDELIGTNSLPDSSNLYASSDTTDLSTGEPLTNLADSDLKGDAAESNLLGFDFLGTWATVDNEYPILVAFDEFIPSFTLTSPDAVTFDWANIYNSNTDQLDIPFDFDANADEEQGTNFNLEVVYPNGTVNTELGVSQAAGTTWSIDQDIGLDFLQSGDYQWYINGNNFEENVNSTTKTFTVNIDEPEINLFNPNDGESFTFKGAYNGQVDKMEIPFDWGFQASQDESMNVELSVTYPDGTNETVTGVSILPGGSWNRDNDYILDTSQTGQYTWRINATGTTSGEEYKKERTFTIQDSRDPTLDLTSPDAESFSWGQYYDEDFESMRVPFTWNLTASPDEPTTFYVRLIRPDGQVEGLTGSSVIPGGSFTADDTRYTIPEEQGNYKWYVIANTTATERTFTSQEYEFQLDIDEPDISLLRPINGETLKYDDTNFQVPFSFNAEASQDEPTNFELILERPDGIEKTVTGVSQIEGTTWDVDDDFRVDTIIGTWSYWIEAEGVQTGNEYKSNVETFETDLENDVVFNLSEPADGSEFETVTGQKKNVTFEFEILSEYQGTAKLYLDGSVNETFDYNNTLSTESYSTEIPLEKGEHEWHVEVDYTKNGNPQTISSRSNFFDVITNPAEEVLLPIIGQIGSIMDIFKANLGTGGLLAVSVILSVFGAGVSHKFIEVTEVTLGTFGALFLVFTISGFVPASIAFVVVILLLLAAAGILRSKTQGGV